MEGERGSRRGVLGWGKCTDVPSLCHPFIMPALTHHRYHFLLTHPLHGARRVTKHVPPSNHRRAGMPHWLRASCLLVKLPWLFVAPERLSRGRERLAERLAPATVMIFHLMACNVFWVPAIFHSDTVSTRVYLKGLRGGGGA